MTPRGLALGLVAILAGCEAVGLSSPDGLRGAKWDVDAVAALPLHDDSYTAAVQSGYVDLAREELNEFDWIDGARFAALARAAAAGTPPGPYRIDLRKFPEPLAHELQLGAAELAVFIAHPGARLRAGRQIGEAQIQYDCWVQEAEEGHQTEDIAACREKYQALMVLVRDLGNLPKNLAVVLPKGEGEIGGIELAQGGRTVTLDKEFAAARTGKRLSSLAVLEDEIREAFLPALNARPEPPEAFTITFGFGSAQVRREARATIEAAVAEARSREAAEIAIIGHADAVGPPQANLALSRQRARAVRRAIRRALTKEERTTIPVMTQGRGERDLAVEVNEADERNRRVVILVR